MWLLIGGISVVFAIVALTLLAIWALTAAERDFTEGDGDGEEG